MESKNVSELFYGATTFEVPPYQREYAWDDEQVNPLLEDLGSFASSSEEFYVLGQLIVAPISGSTDRFAVVDGQQRMTSLYLLLIALLDHYQSFGLPMTAGDADANVMAAVRNALFVRDPADGSEYQRFTATREANGWVSKLLSNQELPAIELNASQENIRNNYQNMLSWVKNNLPTVQALSRFTQRCLYGVFVVSATVQSEEQALDIFEKLNSRGKPLNSAELLKNLIFMNVETSKYEAVATNWTKAAELVFTVRPHKAATMGYLMQALLQPRTGSFVSSKDVYKKWQELIKSGAIPNASDFSEEITASAERMSLVGSARLNDYNRGLLGARFFGVIQHLPAMLEASRFFGSQHYARVMDFVDARITLSLYAEERAQTLYEYFWKLSKTLSEIDANSDLETVNGLLKFDKSEFSLLTSAIQPRFLQYRYTNARDKKRIRFALALAANHVERLAENEGPETTVDALLKTKSRLRPGQNQTSSGYDLDHIFPKSLTLASNFDASWGSDWVHSIGNLCLLHPTDNVQASDALPKLKSSDYASSKLLLTKSLAVPGHRSFLNPRLNTVMNSLTALDARNVETWFFEEAQAQSNLYFELFVASLSTKLGVN